LAACDSSSALCLETIECGPLGSQIVAV